MRDPAETHRVSELVKVHVVEHRTDGCVVLKMPEGWAPPVTEYFLVEDPGTHDITLTVEYAGEDENSFVGRARIRLMLAKSVPALVAILMAWLLYSVNYFLSKFLQASPPPAVEWLLKAILILDLLMVVWLALNEFVVEVRRSWAGHLVLQGMGLLMRLGALLVRATADSGERRQAHPPNTLSENIWLEMECELGRRSVSAGQIDLVKQVFFAVVVRSRMTSTEPPTCAEDSVQYRQARASRRGKRRDVVKRD